MTSLLASGSSFTRHIRGPQTWAAHVSYSQAVVANGFAFLSGQYASGDDGEVVSDDFREQARTVFRNISAILGEVESSLVDVVQLKVFLSRPADFEIYREVRAEFLAEPYPASTVMYVTGFAFPGLLIEVEAVAKMLETRQEVSEGRPT